MTQQIKWVGQRDERGCAIACAAMLTGYSYETSLQWFQGKRTELGGLYLRDIDDYLVYNGYALARKFQFRFGEETKPWPCEPFHDVHLCEVLVSEGSPCNHFIIWLSNYVILDPLTDQLRKLTDYDRILNIAAVVRFRE